MGKTTWKDAGPALVGALLILLFFHPVLFSSKTFFFRDIHRFFYPMKAFLAESLKNGRIPFWNPGIFCGSPFMSDIQSGVFYPPSVLFALLPFPLSLNLYVVMHLFLAFVFFFLFSRSHGLSRGASMIGAIAFTYGGYTISSVNVLNNLSTVTWLPAVLWAHRNATAGRSVHGWFLAIVFLVFALLGGEPQIFAMGAGVLVLLAAAADPEARPHRAAARALVAAALCLPAVMVALVQLGPTWTDFQFSARAGGLPFNEAVRNSLSPKGIVHFLLPLSFGPDFVSNTESLTRFFPGGGIPWLLTVYMGGLALPLTAAAFIIGPANRRRWRALWVLVFSAGLLLSLGRHTPIFILFYKIAPIFRFPEKFVFLCSLSLAVLAAEGADAAATALSRLHVRPQLTLAALCLVMTADLYFHHRYLNPVWDASINDRYHASLTPIVEDTGLFRVYVDGASLDRSPGPETILGHHLRWQAFWLPNLGMAHHVDHVGGKAGLELKHQYFIAELLARPWAGKVRFLRMANVRYIVTAAPLDREPALAGQVTRINPRVFRLDTALPRAWLVGDLQPVKTGTLSDLTQARFNPALSALAPAALARRYHRTVPLPPVAVRRDGPNRIHVVVNAAEPSVLVLSESAYPGWRVQVDGIERPCLWLNLLFQGVALEPGRHQVTFSFRPRRFSIFAGISAAALALLAFSWILASRRVKRPLPKPSRKKKAP